LSILGRSIVREVLSH